MTSFCTVEEYRARYPSDETPTEVLEMCLMDATDVICGELDTHDIEYSSPSESFTYRLSRVCRTMAHRALGRGGESGGDENDIPFGATQHSWTSDVFTESFQLSNPYGDLFMTQSEKESLGIGEMRACVMSPYV